MHAWISPVPAFLWHNPRKSTRGWNYLGPGEVTQLVLLGRKSVNCPSSNSSRFNRVAQSSLLILWWKDVWIKTHDAFGVWDKKGEMLWDGGHMVLLTGQVSGSLLVWQRQWLAEAVGGGLQSRKAMPRSLQTVRGRGVHFCVRRPEDISVICPD